MSSMFIESAQRRKRGWGMAVAVVLLGACASKIPLAEVQKTPTLESVLGQVAALQSTGQPDKAIELLKASAGAYPGEKAIWLKLAQINFDAGRYGSAIEQATEVLVRDPKDKTANSILAVSGLRVATKALADLKAQHDISGTVRSEAQELAKVLREGTGEAVLVPGTAPKVVPASRVSGRTGPRPARTEPSIPSAGPSGNSNPFSALR